MEEANIVVCPKCGFRLQISEEDFAEVAAGVWGTIPCPRCKTYMYDSIKEAAEKQDVSL